MNDEPFEITLLVIAALEQLRIRYLIAGSLASSIYGEPRATRDADLVADIKAEHVQLLCEMLGAQFNISEEAIRNALKYRSSFNLIHYDSLFKVDIFVPKDRKFEKQEFQRMTMRVVALNPERLAYVASPEDVILAKLDWYRLGNEASGQQWRDVVGILKANEGAIDLDYLRQTAKELGVSTLLQRLIPKSPL